MADSPIPLDDTTHQITIHELASSLTSVRELMISRIDGLEGKIDERDRLYKERSDAQKAAVDTALIAAKSAVDTALIAAKEQVTTSFAAAEKAVAKAELAQTAYNERSNEFRKALDDAQRLMIGRPEFAASMVNMNEKVDGLRAMITENYNLTQTIMSEKIDAVSKVSTERANQNQKDIQILREARGMSEGKQVGHTEEQGQTHTASTWTLALVLGGFSLVSLIIAVIGFMKT